MRPHLATTTILGWKGKKNDTSSSSKPTHTNHCNISDVLALGQGPKKEFRKRREFTPIGMTYDAAYDRLHAQGLITPIGPIREPEPKDRSPNWDPNAYCKFHQGQGHSTESCWTLKNRIQDLIETSKLPLPPAGKKPSINMSPLSDTLAISINEVYLDPSTLITPIDEPRIEVAYFDSIEVCTLDSSDEEEETFHDTIDFFEEIQELSNIMASVADVVMDLYKRVDVLEAKKASLVAPAPSPRRAKKHTTTPSSLTITYNDAFDILTSKRLVTPRRSRELPVSVKMSPEWKKSLYCRYHQFKGHTMEKA